MRRDAVHLQARAADVSWHARLKYRVVWHLRSLGGGATIKFGGSYHDYAICGHRLTGTTKRATRDRRQVTCWRCRLYIARYVA